MRGIGVYKSADGLVANLGGEVIESADAIYTAPTRLNLAGGDPPLDAILEFLRMPRWVTPSAPELLFGWAAASVISGALDWRVHVGVTGPAQAGKSTLLAGVKAILNPFAIVREGLSTEAGLRQVIGSDTRPVILDELEAESPRDIERVQRIVKLMRSASSATGDVARGTPSGRALNYTPRPRASSSLRST